MINRLWIDRKTIRCYKFRGIPLLIVSLQANSKDERSLPCETITPKAEQGLTLGCAVTYCEESPALGYQIKGWQ